MNGTLARGNLLDLPLEKNETMELHDLSHWTVAVQILPCMLVGLSLREKNTLNTHMIETYRSKGTHAQKCTQAISTWSATSWTSLPRGLSRWIQSKMRFVFLILKAQWYIIWIYSFGAVTKSGAFLFQVEISKRSILGQIQSLNLV